MPPPASQQPARRGGEESAQYHEARATKAEAANARLKEAVAPFAALADRFSNAVDDYPVYVFVRDLRRARQALDQGAEG